LALDKKMLGAKIKQARDERGWKQKHLAVALHVEPVTVSRWETGRHEPDLSKLELIADALKQPISYFVDVKEPREEFAQILAAVQETQAEMLEEIQALRKELGNPARAQRRGGK